MAKQRSPWRFVIGGLACVLLAFATYVVASIAQSGALVVLVVGVPLALVGVVLLIAGAVGLGVRAGRA